MLEQELDAVEAEPTAEERPGEALESAPEPPPEAPEAEQQQQGIDINALLNRPEIQAVIERRAANLAGNRLQQQQREEQEYQQALAYYKRLEEDDEFFAQEVEKHGKSRVLRWVADFEDYLEQRQKAPMLEPELAKLREEFNAAAVEAFKNYVRQTGLFDRLPAETRQVIESLRPDSETPWIQTALEQLVKTVDQFTGQGRVAKQAEAMRQAFQNQPGAPIPAPAATRQGVNPRRIIEEYAYGQGNWTLEDYDWARKQLGQDY